MLHLQVTNHLLFKLPTTYYLPAARASKGASSRLTIIIRPCVRLGLQTRLHACSCISVHCVQCSSEQLALVTA